MTRRLALLIAVAAAGCSSSEDAATTSCDPIALAKSSAGSTARDCGHVAVGADPKPAWKCATDAFRAGEAFRVSEALHGIDSTITFSVARGPDGVLHIVSRDSDPGGGSGSEPSVTRVTCRPGSIVTSQRDGIDRIECSGNYTTAKLCGR